MRMRRKTWTEPLLDNCPYLVSTPREWKGCWRTLFARPDQPLEVEIGCGKGVSTVRMAHEHPGTNYIAIDEVRHVLAVTIKNAGIEYDADPVDNLILTNVDAMFISDSFCEADKVSRIHICFPNPWTDKSKQHKRRLTHPRQLMQYRRFLAPDGEIYFKTDDTTLFEASVRYLNACGFVITYRTDDLHASGFTPNYITEHEALYTSRGIPIHFLIARMTDLPENFEFEIEGRPFDFVENGNTHRTENQELRFRHRRPEP